MSGETSKSKSPDKPRKRASAVDLSFGNVLNDLENDPVLGPSVEPDPLFPALGLPEPIPDVFINVSRGEKRKVESPDTSKHRRLEQDGSWLLFALFNFFLLINVWLHIYY